jgi:predicted nucleic acid-binding protein
VDFDIAIRAAKIRATHRLRTPDAIQASTTIQSGATGFVTNDTAFRRIEAFEALILEDLL